MALPPAAGLSQGPQAGQFFESVSRLKEDIRLEVLQGPL